MWYWFLSLWFLVQVDRCLRGGKGGGTRDGREEGSEGRWERGRGVGWDGVITTIARSR